MEEDATVQPVIPMLVNYDVRKRAGAFSVIIEQWYAAKTFKPFSKVA